MGKNNNQYSVYDIEAQIIETWNTRLQGCVKRTSQKQVLDGIKKMCDSSKSISQATLSRWMHVGEPQKGYPKGLPDYINMRLLADYFGVSVGYLTGETDNSSFLMQDACEYTGLEEATLRTIRDSLNIQDSVGSYPYRHAVDRLFASPELLTFLSAFLELEDAVQSLQEPFKQLKNELGSARFEKALEAYAGPNDYLTDESMPHQLRSDCSAIDVAIDTQHDLSYEVKVARYELNEAFENLIESIFPRLSM